MSTTKQFKRGGYLFKLRVGEGGYPLLETYTLDGVGPFVFDKKQWYETSISEKEVRRAADKIIKGMKRKEQFSEKEPGRREETQRSIDALDL